MNAEPQHSFVMPDWLTGTDGLRPDGTGEPVGTRTQPTASTAHLNYRPANPDYEKWHNPDYKNSLERAYAMPYRPATVEPLRQNPNLTTFGQQLQQTLFENLFETVLDKIAAGVSLQEALRDDVRQPDYTAFLRWLHKDPSRRSRYHEAQEIGGEMIASEIIGIADGTDTIEDVQRSRLRIDTRQFLLKVWNRKRYGDIKQLDVSGNISITDALTAARARVVRAELIEDAVLIDDRSPAALEYFDDRSDEDE
jgi:hypothetical protein